MTKQITQEKFQEYKNAEEKDELQRQKDYNNVLRVFNSLFPGRKEVHRDERAWFGPEIKAIDICYKVIDRDGNETLYMQDYEQSCIGGDRWYTLWERYDFIYRRNGKEIQSLLDLRTQEREKKPDKIIYRWLNPKFWEIVEGSLDELLRINFKVN